MSAFLTGVGFFLVLNVAAGLLRVVRGPTQADRMVAAQLFGTSGVAVLLVLAEASNEPSLRDTALVFTILAVVVSVAFVKRGWIRKEDSPAEEELDRPPDEPERAGRVPDAGEESDDAD